MLRNRNSGDEGAVVGGETPIGKREDVSPGGNPFPLHGVTEENVINARIGVVGGVIMSPGDITRGEAAVGVGRGIAVALGGAGVDEGFPAAAKNGFEGLG